MVQETENVAILLKTKLCIVKKADIHSDNMTIYRSIIHNFR